MRDIKDVALELARAHRQADHGTSEVKFFPNGGEQIRLLEISSATPRTGEILPFQFDADPSNGIDYPSVVILINPDEWADVQAGRLELPSGWNLAQAEDLKDL